MYTVMNICMISNVKDTVSDERITIRPNLVKAVDGDASMEYDVSHTIPSSMLKSKESMTTKMTLRSMKELITYIESLLVLVHMDESPYASIQFDLPMIPSVILSPKNLHYTVRDSIIKHLKLLENTWPVVPLPSSRRNSVAWACNYSNENPCCETMKPKLNKHIFFNDEDTSYHPEYCL